MKSQSLEKDILFKIPSVRGILKRSYKLSDMNWFKVGGKAEVLFFPNDLKDLQNLIKKIDKNIPISVIGAGSNTLIRDGGLGGIVIKLGKPFCKLEVLKMNKVRVGAAYNCIKLSRKLAKQNLSGLEFFTGIPGTVGGAIFMNAGAFDVQTSNVLEEIKVLDKEGKIKKFFKEELKMSYRSALIPDNSIIIEATFICKKDKANKIFDKIKCFEKKRSRSQPIKKATGGSTFKNPKNRKAWKLIKDSGCEGMFVGKAKLSEMHSNFIINEGRCSSNDIETLGENIRKKVKDSFGVELEWEIKIIGSKKKYKRFFYD